MTTDRKDEIARDEAIGAKNDANRRFLAALTAEEVAGFIRECSGLISDKALNTLTESLEVLKAEATR